MRTISGDVRAQSVVDPTRFGIVQVKASSKKSLSVVRTGQRSAAAGAPARMAPLKLAIIGGGPSSFYVASRLLSLFPKDGPLASQLKIHIYDRLWAPHGLVRYGVAPDHPEVKVRSLLPRPVFPSNSCIISH